MSKNKLAAIIVACTIAIIVAIVLFSFKPWECVPPGRSYTLITNISAPGGGSVSPSGGEYDAGEQVTLTASSASGYTFDYWSGDASGSSNTVTITMNSDKTVTAHFEPKTPPGSIPWDEAKYHIGERTTVCGPVVDAEYASESSGQPTFLNLGEPYPDPGRFTVVIWGRYRDNFPQPPEEYYLGKTICVTGLIVEYKGTPEIEVRLRSEIQDP